MEKILIEIKHKNLSFSYCDWNQAEGNFTSVTENGINTIITTLEYINKKIDLFTLYISRSINENDITILNINDFSLTEIAFKLTTEKNFEKINFPEETSLPKEVYNLITKSKDKTKAIDCYSISKEMFESLSGNNIKVNLQKVDFLINKLMEHNNFKTYADVEEAKTIDFDFIPDTYDLEDFNNFLKVNENLEEINIKIYYDGLEKQIISILTKNKKTGITINIYENNEDIVKYLPHLKKLRKKCRKVCAIEFIYSKKYKNKLLKLKITNALITIFTISIVILIILYVCKTIFPQ